MTAPAAPPSPTRTVGTDDAPTGDRTDRDAAVVAGGTLASRVTGLLRDVATAALLGQGAVADAFVFAWTIPNLFRAFLGDGALAGAFLPAYVKRLRRNGSAAARSLLGAVAGRLILVLLVCVVGLWGAAALWGRFAGGPGPGLLFLLAPYALLACLAALLSSARQARGSFLAPAVGQAVVNCAWAGAAVGLLWTGTGGTGGARVLAGAILVGGGLQLVLLRPLPADDGPPLPAGTVRRETRVLLARMAPLLLAALAVEANVLVDRLVAWSWAPGGAVSGLYYANRLVQIPVALVGLSVATAAFPVLARHASDGDRVALAGTVDRSLDRVLLLALPAAAGIAVVASPLASLLFERGAFDAVATRRTALLTAGYAVGVWATVSSAVLARALHAVGDARGILRATATGAAINIGLDLALVGPLGGLGVAVATATAAVVTWVGLRRRLADHLPPDRRPADLAALGRYAPLALPMAAGVHLLLAGPAAGLRPLLAVAVAVPAGALLYGAALLTFQRERTLAFLRGLRASGSRTG